MTTMTQRHQHPTEPICPPWCAGHSAGYQGWEDRGEGAKTRNHCEDPVLVQCVRVKVCSVEQADRTMGPAAVEIFVDGRDGRGVATLAASRPGLRVAGLVNRERIGPPPGRAVQAGSTTGWPRLWLRRAGP